MQKNKLLVITPPIKTKESRMKSLILIENGVYFVYAVNPKTNKHSMVGVFKTFGRAKTVCRAVEKQAA